MCALTVGYQQCGGDIVARPRTDWSVAQSPSTYCIDTDVNRSKYFIIAVKKTYTTNPMMRNCIKSSKTMNKIQ